MELNLYFGRDKPAGGEVSDAEWAVFLADTMTPQFPAGLTVIDARGQHRDPAGVIGSERTKLVVVVVFDAPAHPYTQALFSAVPTRNPELKGAVKRIRLQGDIPSPINPPSGCRFHTRCPIAQARCRSEEPQLTEQASDHLVACHFPGQDISVAG